MVEVGSKIKELREAKKISQKELAAFLHVTPQAVSKWENNKSYPDLDTLVQLSHYFRISTDKLLGNSKPSFFAALFSKGGSTMEKTATKNHPDGPVPKLVQVAVTASYLVLTFDNQETRYLRSHLAQDQAAAYSAQGTGKRALLLAQSRQSWLGTTSEILPDGTLVLNDTDRYTPEELWYDSKESTGQ
ncbi:helix-turn-helix domain-containing protein [Enterococcus asini]|uniref:helix-turn-helix domain-containing protein n=1 Tax=Enterococcus asini TaxID=57732 RepID=UPI00266D2121|nr:helix-turn-helix transcriptional regulator [Enterococcus asini]